MRVRTVVRCNPEAAVALMIIPATERRGGHWAGRWLQLGAALNVLRYGFADPRVQRGQVASLSRQAAGAGAIVAFVLKITGMAVQCHCFILLALREGLNWHHRISHGNRCFSRNDCGMPWQIRGACSSSSHAHEPGTGDLFVADHLGAALAVVEVVGNADHAHGADVVGGCGLDRTSAAHAAQHRDGDDGSVRGIHAVSVASDGGGRGRGEVGV